MEKGGWRIRGLRRGARPATVPWLASNSLIMVPSLALPMRLLVMKPGERWTCSTAHVVSFKRPAEIRFPADGVGHLHGASAGTTRPPDSGRQLDERHPSAGLTLPGPQNDGILARPGAHTVPITIRPLEHRTHTQTPRGAKAGGGTSGFPGPRDHHLSRCGPLTYPSELTARERYQP